MKFYAYTRVSTTKQGEKGVSLQEQHAAIARYAEHQGLQITEWFEEVLTAAKKGRPLFARMMQGLRSGKAQGVIIHKIDRGARNLRDWTDLGDLIDAGVAVHFANESLDLHSRGGRLSADIQAVVAADYIRNLREETLKGIRGRLRQGLLPFCAPLGYVNTGKGQVKTIDPLTGPLIRQAFELYATGRHTLKTLLAELNRRGLRNRRGRTVFINDLSRILNNPFYTGLIRIRPTGETYPGAHAPLVTTALFRTVQARLTRRLWTKKWIHDFTFRGLFHCSLCGRNLIAELQKGHVYYRCQTRGCPTRTFREEVLEAATLNSWPAIANTEESRDKLAAALDYVQKHDEESDAERTGRIRTQIGAVRARVTRLIDAFVDGTLTKEDFDERKRTLLEEQHSLEKSLHSDRPDPEDAKALIAELLELASSAQQSYRVGNTESRRELVIRLSSNLSVAGKDVSVEPCSPLRCLAKREPIIKCAHFQYRARTKSTSKRTTAVPRQLEETARELLKWATEELKRRDRVGNKAA
jgi:site-specific DNA recombinase